MPTCPRCSHSWAPVSQPLTMRQRQVLDFILTTMAAKGYAPSLQEIANHLGVRSSATVHEHLQRLERKGYITREPDKARAITAAVA